MRSVVASPGKYGGRVLPKLLGTPRGVSCAASEALWREAEGDRSATTTAPRPGGSLFHIHRGRDSWGWAMSAVLMVLPMVWAMEDQSPEVIETDKVITSMAFYRKYTEALLRRYVKMSMEAGRAPSLLGREMFRGRVTSYRVHSFEDVVIFVHDVEKCIKTLEIRLQQMLHRVALQEYTFQETAALLGLPLRTVVRRYARALDKLTPLLMAARLLEPQKVCQGVWNEENLLTI